VPRFMEKKEIKLEKEEGVEIKAMTVVKMET
jgi:hypothetical protein